MARAAAAPHGPTVHPHVLRSNAPWARRLPPTGRCSLVRGGPIPAIGRTGWGPNVIGGQAHDARQHLGHPLLSAAGSSAGRRGCENPYCARGITPDRRACGGARKGCGRHYREVRLALQNRHKQRVVVQHRADAGEDGAGPGAPVLHIGAGGISRDPLALSRWAGRCGRRG